MSCQTDIRVLFCSQDNPRIVLDPQGYYAQFGLDISAGRATIPAVKSLLASCRDADFPIFWTREGHRADLSSLPERELLRSRLAGAEIGSKGPLGRLLIRGEPGWEIVPELDPKEGEPIVDKPMRSAFAYTDFELLLNNRGIRNLILCGVVTDVCVLGTMKDACDKGYDCLLVTDACAAAAKDVHDAIVKSVITEGGICGAAAEAKHVVDVLQMWRSHAEEKKGIAMVEEIMKMARG